MPLLARLLLAPLRARTTFEPKLNRTSKPFALAAAILLVSITAFSNPATAESRVEMQALDEQVQEIKSEVLAIAEELQRLEEKLLFPANTQVAVFVSMPKDKPFRLDSVKVEIDGKPSARHIYSFKELEALKKGGVQRLFTGNLATGKHRILVEVAGQLANGAEVLTREQFEFEKAAEPKLVELTLAGRDVGGVQIELGER